MADKLDLSLDEIIKMSKKGKGGGRGGRGGQRGGRGRGSGGRGRGGGRGFGGVQRGGVQKRSNRGGNRPPAYTRVSHSVCMKTTLIHHRPSYFKL